VTTRGKHLSRLGGLTASFLILMGAGPALAGSATSNFTVTAAVANNCTISSTAIGFGDYDPIVANASTPLDVAGTVVITCTKGAATTIGLNTGNNAANASGTTRAMKSGSDYLSYEIYQEAARTTVWGNSGTGLFTPPAAPSKNPRTFQTYGRVPAAQDVPAGASYTDTVTATVNF